MRHLLGTRGKGTARGTGGSTHRRYFARQATLEGFEIKDEILLQPRPDEGYLTPWPPKSNKDRKAGTGTRSQRRGRRSLSGRRGGASRPSHDLLISAALLPISGLARKGREAGQRWGTLRRDFTLAALVDLYGCLTVYDLIPQVGLAMSPRTTSRQTEKPRHSPCRGFVSHQSERPKQRWV